jgi:predicted transcriptional regulator
MKNTIQSIALAAETVIRFEKRYDIDFKRFLVLVSISNEANTAELIVKCTGLGFDMVRFYVKTLTDLGFVVSKRSGKWALLSCTQKALDFLSQIEKDNNH